MTRRIIRPRLVERDLAARADYVGRNIPTSRQQSVQVRLLEIDGLDQVEVEG